MTTVITGALVALAVVFAFGIVFRRLLAPQGRHLDVARIERLSVDSYRPLARLLSEQDFEFVRVQPGFEPSLEKHLRRQRRHVSRAYLRSLGRDFRALHTAARILLVHSPVDRPDLAMTLFRQSLQFWAGYYAVEMRLVWNALGIAPVPVDCSTLLAPAGWMQNQLRMLAQPAARPA